MSMRPRRAFRPTSVEAMEDRVVLSHGLAPTVSIALVPTVPKHLKLGALGDSFTDEYRFYTPDRSQARNWVEILAATRRINFGRFSPFPRSEPRNAGFANNWARSGATSDDMVQNQLPGLADQVRKGQVNVVTAFVGGNDFLYYLEQNASPVSGSSADPVAGVAAVESRAEDNLTTAVRTLEAANPDVKIVLVTLPDVTKLPIVSSSAANAMLKPLLDATSAAVAKYNARIQALAANDPNVAVADLATEYAGLLQQQAASGSVSVGGQAISLTTTGDEYHHFFLADGIHIGTVAQAGLANLIVQTLDSHYNAGINPLSEAEVIKVAKRPPRK